MNKNPLMNIAVLYTAFAICAISANITSQEISIRLYGGPYGIWVSITVGTAVGLMLKYFLDKKFIFYFKAKNVAHDGQIFIIYATMGILTTAIFWVLELSFAYWFQSKLMQYIGAVLGLSIGYWTKYQLDKRLTFNNDSIVIQRLATIFGKININLKIINHTKKL